MAISQLTLRSKACSYQHTLDNMQKALSESHGTTQWRMAFLCHSHKDETLAKGLVVIFREAGLNLYIDWQDHTMPETPNSETARKIQEKIKKAAIFLFLATENSKTSRWCPWEIGYADSSIKPIYVIPTSDGYGTYGNEYLQLYPHIDEATLKKNRASCYAVFRPGKSEGQLLSENTLK